MNSVQVYLDNYNHCCYPGQTITGRVECCFIKETKLRGGTGFRLPPGRHTYPFSYILPARLPSSFEGSYGNVRYYIKAIVDRPWKFNYEHLFILHVVSPLDLNYIPGVRDPVVTSIDKTICSCWCINSGALTFEMFLPVAGFVPGQEVNISAYIENMTNVSVVRVQFEIIAKLEFRTRGTNSVSDKQSIAVCRAEGVGAHGDKSWTSTLTIPGDLPYPDLIPCSIINLSYQLKTNVVLPWPHTNLKNEVPIVIGAVPLVEVANTFYANPDMFPTPTEETSLLPNAFPCPYDIPSYLSGRVHLSSGGGFERNTPGGVPYASEAIPYPASTSNSLDFIDLTIPIKTTHPSASSVNAPYPYGPGVPPYPSDEFFNSFAPSGSGGASYLATEALVSTNSLPSYEEAQKLKEMNEKSG